jgi:hypothetical protein
MIWPRRWRREPDRTLPQTNFSNSPTARGTVTMIARYFRTQRLPGVLQRLILAVVVFMA